MKRILLFVLILCLALPAFASCGAAQGPAAPVSSEPAQTEPAIPDIPGDMDGHGVYTVFVPEGYSLVHEDAFGDNDPNSFYIVKDGGGFDYFMFNIYPETSALSGIEATKNFNEGAADVTAEYGGRTWKGVAYDTDVGPCFHLYADFDGTFVVVAGAGNAYDGELAACILGSVGLAG